MYYSTDFYQLGRKEAKRLEAESKWAEAARKWRSLRGHEDDAAACELLADAISRGDRFRELTAPAFEDLENRKINLSEFHVLLTDAQKRVYG